MSDETRPYRVERVTRSPKYPWGVDGPDGGSDERFQRKSHAQIHADELNRVRSMARRACAEELEAFVHKFDALMKSPPGYMRGKALAQLVGDMQTLAARWRGEKR